MSHENKSDPKYIELKGPLAVAIDIHAEVVDRLINTTFQANPKGALPYMVRVRHAPGTSQYEFMAQKPEDMDPRDDVIPGRVYDLALYPDKSLGHLSVIGFEIGPGVTNEARYASLEMQMAIPGLTVPAPNDLVHFTGVLDGYCDYLTRRTQ